MVSIAVRSNTSESSECLYNYSKRIIQQYLRVSLRPSVTGDLASPPSPPRVVAQKRGTPPHPTLCASSPPSPSCVVCCCTLPPPPAIRHPERGHHPRPTICVVSTSTLSACFYTSIGIFSQAVRPSSSLANFAASWRRDPSKMSEERALSCGDPRLYDDEF